VFTAPTGRAGRTFSETFDERRAAWADTPKITTWLARMQFLPAQVCYLDAVILRPRPSTGLDRNTGGPVDVWAVDGIDPRQLRTSPSGHQYFPDTIAPQQLALVRQDVYL
jgi:hypothetical protein